MTLPKSEQHPDFAEHSGEESENPYVEVEEGEENLRSRRSFSEKTPWVEKVERDGGALVGLFWRKE